MAEKNTLVNAENPNVKLAFESKAGTKIYSLVSVMDISALRGVAAESAQRFSKMKITEKELKALIRAQKVAINTEQDFVKAFGITQEIEYRLEMICEANSLFDLAAIYYMIEGEDTEIPREDINVKKKQMFDEESDLRTFFLLAGLSLTQLYSPQQGVDLLVYLEETKHLAQRIYQYIAK